MEQDQNQILQTKLSDIFYWASINLRQVRFRVGNLEKKEACASGAINYFLSQGKCIKLRDIKKTYPITRKRIVKFKEKNFHKMSIMIFLNDWLGIKFEKLAKLCKRFNW